MQAIRELEELRKRLEAQLSIIQGEIDTISRTIKIIERETPNASPQMNLPSVVTPALGESTNAVASPAPHVVKNELGLSALCRQIASDWIAPSEVRDKLLSTGYHNTDKNKLLSSVYATLKRLSDNGHMDARKENGRTEFRTRNAVVQAA